MSYGPDIDKYMKENAALVSDYLLTVFSSDQEPNELYEAMKYSLMAGGKRLRPILCLATAGSFGVAVDDVLPAAAAIEILHTYSLIHDDLPALDNDDLRRGKPTNHKVFGEAIALLAGDGLLTMAFELLSLPMRIPSQRQLQMVHVLARAAGSAGMVGGQVADVQAEKVDGTLERLQFIHENKTAKLIQASIYIGALFAELPWYKLEALQTFGMELGLSFQIMDDLLDVVGTTEELGKTVGSDLRLDKLTYPRIVGLTQTREFAEAAVNRGIQALTEAEIEAPVLVGIAEQMLERLN